MHPILRRHLLHHILPGLAAACAVVRSPQAAFPERPLRMVVGYAAGGGTDLTARALAAQMAAQLGQQIVIENRGGGGGVPAVQAVLQAPADGHMLMFSTGAVLVARALGTPVPFDPLEALAPVGLLGVSPNVLVVHPAIPATDLATLRDFARRRTEPLRFGSPSIGYTTALISQELDIETEEVRYRGTGPLMSDLLAGRLDGYLIPLPGIQAAIRSGELRAIAVSYRRRLAALPQVATTLEQGFPNLQAFTWTGIEVRRGTPPDCIERLESALNACLRDMDLRTRLAETGVEAADRTDPRSFRALVVEEQARAEAVIRRFNLRG